MDKTALELTGSGSGYGDGYGYGYGDGYGYGSGDGSGYGYGSGSGYGYGGYLQAILSQYQRNPNTKVCFWRSTKKGKPANGGNGTIAKLGLTETVTGPLKICTDRALHGTINPSQWKGEYWWIVELHEPFVNQDDKFASLSRTFLADLGKCPF